MRDGGARQSRATDAIRQAISAATEIRLVTIGEDDDLIDDLAMNSLELESLSLVLEEIFAIQIPAQALYGSPLYRTPSALAEWAIRASDQAAWAEAQRPPQRIRRA
jgi:acyl carrier protein